MKVRINPYVNYIGPYQIAEKILFWKDPYNEAVMRLGDFLCGKNDNSLLLKVCRKIYNYRSSRPRAFVSIDPYDTWSMDETLAHIIIPMLKQLKETKQGSPLVDDADVPDELKSINSKIENEDFGTDNNVHNRWSWVLDEMIWAFEYKLHDDSDLYDEENEKRMANGFRLFGVYYQGLWD